MEKCRDLFGQPFDARSAGDQALRLMAGRAFMRAALDMSAMMADQRAPKAMIDQPGRAVRALEAVAAIATERQRCVAAPVEEKQRLLLGLDIGFDRLDQRAREPAPPLRLVAAQVDQAELRQFASAEALRQLEMGVAASLGIDAGFERRRRRGEHDRGVLDASRTTAMSRAW